jgi:glycosyltransferase involved in cell wall biosynthesis
MRRVLLEQGFPLHDIFPLDVRPRWHRWAYKVTGRATQRFYHWDREPEFLAELKRQIEDRCQSERIDILFAPSSLPLTLVETRARTAFSTDQMFPSLFEGYVRPPTARYRDLGMRQERLALARADLVVLPSRWAVDTAVTACGADRNRLRQIPWGANLAREPSNEAVVRMIDARTRRRSCNLVFIGREWHRKGGDLVVATVRHLRERGLAPALTIIGAEPPEPLPPGTNVIPFLDKSTAEGAGTFDEVMAAADLLFVPSRAEAYGQVFCEAAAFGLPVVSSRVGGIPSIVEDGVTGRLCHLPATASSIAAVIAELVADRDTLAAMGAAARRRYVSDLNWRVFGERLASALMNQRH